MGLPGVIGSIDGVHIHWNKCPTGLSHVCTGKEKFPALGYSVIVNHNKRILASTASFYGTRNDKLLSTISLIPFGILSS
jgi:Plant transposon protein